ncbi:30S ribosomal protein S11 domain protein [Teladorsagia circumcincta]|uniref:30S ribosomal protein S11 domain protein n=1 Tax=Teladorsagia circumcincta TaxID=45464 RepID=A0A2G9V069_TELCI|nr:30S ribosomal protein S11 domain protein [Teladorsagia circumcincta]
MKCLIHADQHVNHRAVIRTRNATKLVESRSASAIQDSSVTAQDRAYVAPNADQRIAKNLLKGTAAIHESEERAEIRHGNDCALLIDPYLKFLPLPHLWRHSSPANDLIDICIPYLATLYVCLIFVFSFRKISIDFKR